MEQSDDLRSGSARPNSIPTEKVASVAVVSPAVSRLIQEVIHHPAARLARLEVVQLEAQPSEQTA